MKVLPFEGGGLSGPELFSFLRTHKGDLIKQKKWEPQKGITITAPTETVVTTKDGATKAADVPVDELLAKGSVNVTVVANSANWMDSQKDVLLEGAAKRSINNNKGMIPHLHDHIHLTTAVVGDVLKIYPKNIKLIDLGLRNREGTTESIIFNTDILKSYNQQIFEQYARGQINQHSIGLEYEVLLLAINSAEDYYKEEFANWNKYLERVINKEDAEESGYFWVVPEYKLMENSCVLWGANRLTPTLDAKDDHPTPDTAHQHSSLVVTESGSMFDIDAAIKQTKFF
jgi:hypothetical protein